MRQGIGKTGKRLLAAAWAMLMLLGMNGCGVPPETLNRYQISSLELFDTVTVITGYAADETAFRKKADAILEELGEYHRLYDIYHTYEGIHNAKTVNDQAGGAPVTVDSRLLDLLELGERICRESGGKTDITLGAVLGLWHQAREAAEAHPETAVIPDREALEEAKRHTGFELLEMDREQGTVRLTDPEARLDLGALAKGYAVQQVCGSLEAGWLVSVGGNVYASGPKPDNGGAWSIGIQEPDGGGSDFLHVVTAEKGAIVTSGDYQRYYEVDGKRYHHLIDPETCMPGEKWRAVTVLHEDSGVADGLSTALFLMDREEGESLLERLGGEACWVDADGRVWYSQGYEARLKAE